MQASIQKAAQFLGKKDASSLEVNGFAPIEESVQEILQYTMPSSKKILTVAGYGYPIIFLAEGASNVVSFDISERAISWNYLLRGMIETSSFKENCDFLNGRMSNCGLEEIIERASSTISGEYIFPARELAHKYTFKIQKEKEAARDAKLAQETPKEDSLLDKMFDARKLEIVKEVTQKFMEEKNIRVLESFNPQKVEECYLHIRDRATFESVKDAVSAGKWKIKHMELFDALNQAGKTQQKFDVVYLSSIRQLVYYMFYAEFGRKQGRSSVLAYLGGYDEQLGKLLLDAISKDAVVYNSIVDRSAFPEMPFRPPFGFKKESYESDCARTVGAVESRKRLRPFTNHNNIIEILTPIPSTDYLSRIRQFLKF